MNRVESLESRARGVVWLPPFLALLLCACPGLGGHGQTSDGSFSLVEVPNPLSGDNPRFPLDSAAVPGPGKSVPDSRLKTTQTRVVGAGGLRHEYARFDPFNSDRTRILLLSLAQGEWRIYRTSPRPYDGAANLVRALSVEEPRWDETDPNVIWATQDFRIVRISADTGDAATVKDFRQDATVGPVLQAEPDLYRITMKDEGEASLDRRYWAFIVQGSNEDYRARYLLVWDRQADRVLGWRKLAANESNIDWVGMSPKGTWVLIGADFDNGGVLPGFLMADRGLTQFYKLHYSTGHADVGLDALGKEVVVMQNAQTDYVDLIPLDPSTKPIPPGGSYTGSGHEPLVRLFYDTESPLGLNSGVHISCNFPGWCVVSTVTEPGAAEHNWLDRSIVVVRLDRAKPRTYYLAKVYGTRGDYWEETQGTISRDGTRVLWATNWNQNVGQNKVWDMELNLPANWPALLKP